MRRQESGKMGTETLLPLFQTLSKSLPSHREQPEYGTGLTYKEETKLVSCSRRVGLRQQSWKLHPFIKATGDQGMAWIGRIRNTTVLENMARDLIQLLVTCLNKQLRQRAEKYDICACVRTSPVEWLLSSAELDRAWWKVRTDLF